MYCSILILQISNSPGLSIGTLDAATICADSESISSSKEILCIQIECPSFHGFNEVNKIAKKTVPVYVAEGLLLDMQKTQADVAAMIAKAI
ncbi:hypothetical protein Tco_1156782 [Tanacetum coccineum]